MYITFYNFAKRSNSTRVPDFAGDDFPNCQLKDTTNIIAPTIIMQAMPTADITFWNYCWFPTWRRYYFINTWRWMNGVWEADCVIDVLASYKNQIGLLTEYVTRASAEYDEYLPDTYYATSADVRMKKTIIPTYYESPWAGGFYVIGLISGEQEATQGAVAYYQMTAAEFARFRDYLLSDTFLQQQGLVNLADFIPADATKVIFNPFQYIVSCKWYPFPASTIPNQSQFKEHVDSIRFGWWSSGTGFSAYLLKGSVATYSISQDVYLTNHPETATRGVWLNRSPYTQRILKIPPYQDIHLTDTQITDDDGLRLIRRTDFITGTSYLDVWVLASIGTSDQRETDLIARVSQDISVDIQLAQVGKDYIGAFATQYENKSYMFNKILGSSVDLSSIGSAMASGAQLGVTLGQMSDYQTVAAGDYLRASAPQLLTSGVNGTPAAYALNAYLFEYYYMLEADDNEHVGRPLSALRQINTIPGYIKIDSPDVALHCLESERTLITRFFQTGFYFE